MNQSWWGKKSSTSAAAYVLTKPQQRILYVVIIVTEICMPFAGDLLVPGFSHWVWCMPWQRTGAVFFLAVVPLLISPLNNSTLYSEINTWQGKKEIKSGCQGRLLSLEGICDFLLPFFLLSALLLSTNFSILYIFYCFLNIDMLKPQWKDHLLKWEW